jgi:hypothetical protein
MSACAQLFALKRRSHRRQVPGNILWRSLRNVGFQTCRLASLKLAGREVAPAVGLEICAAASERGVLLTI